MSRKEIRGGRTFRTVTTAFAVGFAVSVALLLAFDVGYLVEFSLRASPERAGQVARAVFSPETRQELLLSLVTATLTTVLAILIAIPGGYALSRFRIPGKVVFDTFVDAAIVLPPLIMGVSLLVVFSALRRIAEALGQPGAPQPALQAVYDFFVYRRPGIVLAQFFVSTALCVRAMRSAFDAADRRVEAVALTLGCTPFGAFWHAGLPQTISGILAGAVVSWSYALGLYAPVAIFAGTIRGRTTVLPTRTFLEVSVGHLEIGLALTILMAGIAMLLLVALKIALQRRGRGVLF
ncbi:MAG: ABC transporter permease subunit [Kiritimatiellae bacterium]|nr:ABC transporter permease subunit [Kiritimatiellia bacterium]